MKSWKTTASGVLSIVAATTSAVNALLNGQPVDWNTTMAAIIAGLGLIAARDHDISSKAAGIEPK